MTPRLNPMTAAPEVMQGMIGLEKAVTASGLEPTLIHLVKMRASQINGCAFCLKMHSKDARAPDDDYEAIRAQFDEAERVKLTLLVAAINAWNRICVGFRIVPLVEGDSHVARH